MCSAIIKTHARLDAFEVEEGELAASRRQELGVFLADIAALQGACCVADYLDCHPGNQKISVEAIGRVWMH